MRFEVSIILTGNPPYEIPSNYRRNIMAFIKESLKGQDVFDRYFNKEERKPKPFTFSLSFQPEKKQKQKGRIALNSDKLVLHFSSYDYEFLIQIYNGLLKLHRAYPVFKGYQNYLRNFHLQKDVKISEDEVVFKTYSPVLVRDFNGRKGNGFIDNTHEKFIPNLCQSISAMCKRLADVEVAPDEIKITPVKLKSDIINQYGGELGTSGVFMIKAPKKVLRLVYDAGIGAKRSQGFGMLEVVA